MSKATDNEIRFTWEGVEISLGSTVWTRELVTDRRAELTIRRARKAHYCDDVASNLHRIEKGELHGTDSYGAVHYCLDCIQATP